MKSKYIFFFFFLTVLPFAIRAQSITGHIRDTDNNPVPFATVAVKGTTTGATTDDKGYFTLDIRQPEAMLAIRCVGFEEQDLTVKAGAKPLEVRLSVKENFLNQVVVTGTRTERTLKDAPVLTKVVSAADLHDIGAVTALDALESMMPGVHFDPNPMGDNIQIQGLGNSYILVLVNGERLAPERNENINFARLNVADIERIEIINGASSVLYGSNAMGAVINIITKDVKKPFEGYVQGRYSEYGTFNADAGLGFKWKGLSSKTGFNMKTTDGYDLTPETPASYTVNPNTDYTVSQSFGYSFSDKLSAGLDGRYYSHETLNPPQSTNVTHRKDNDYTVGGRITYAATEKNTLTFSGNSDMYKSYTVYERLNDSTSLNADFTCTTFRLTDAWTPSDKLQVVGGAEYNYESMFSYNLLGKDKTDASAYNNALFAQGDWKFVRNMEVTAGLRMTQHSEFGTHIAPSLSLMYNWKRFKFRAGVSNGFKTPTLKELYYDFDHSGMFWVKGNTDLKPETSWYESFSVEYLYEDLNVSFTAYNNNIDDKINTVQYNVTKPDGSQMLEMRYENVADARIYGFDVFVQWRFLKYWYLKGGYNYANATDRASGLQLAGNSKNNGNAALTFKYPRLRLGRNEYPLALTLSGRVMSPRIYQNVTVDASGNETITADNTKAYSIWRLMYTQQIPIAGRFTAELQAGIDNLFNYVDSETFSVVNPGRTFSVMAKISF